MAHVVWDWNGTLLDDLELIVDSANAALGALGARPISIEEYQERFTRPVHDFYGWALGRDVDPGESETIDRAFFRSYHAGLDEVGLHPEAHRAVSRAAELGATQSVLSMWWHERLVRAVERFGLGGFMLVVDGLRGEAGASKTRHLGEHLGRLREHDVQLGGVVVIGDVADDAVAAEGNGVGCVLVEGGSQSRRALLTTGWPVVGSLCDAVELAVGGRGGPNA